MTEIKTTYSDLYKLATAWNCKNSGSSDLRVAVELYKLKKGKSIFCHGKIELSQTFLGLLPAWG